jgi:hypothetical protein
VLFEKEKNTRKGNSKGVVCSVSNNSNNDSIYGAIATLKYSSCIMLVNGSRLPQQHDKHVQLILTGAHSVFTNLSDC